MIKHLTEGLLLVSKPLKEVPPGYERTTDPRVYARKLKPCVHRTWKIIYKQCCGNVKLMFCDKHQKNTNRGECHRCQTT